MEVLLIRHAIAEDRDPARDDTTRKLTSKGERRFRGVVRGLEDLGVNLTAIVHSPWTRALETAQLLLPLAPSRLGDIKHATPLLCASPAPALVAMMADLGRAGTLAVVGHEPWLGELAALLTFGDPLYGDRIPFKKGGVVWLDGTIGAGGMSLRAILTPAILRAID